MIIINATTKVKAIMTDRGEMITIKPGECTGLMIASRNLIISAINLGTPSEIGIIISGSYELDIVKNITGATPYLYTSLEEAKSKLIDPSIDYSASLADNVADSKFNEERNKLMSEIATLQEKINSLSTELESAKKSERTDELELEVTELTTKLSTTNNDLVRANSRIKELLDDVRNLTETTNKLRLDIGIKSQDLTAANEAINKLQEELKSTSEVDSSMQDKVEQLNGLVESKDAEIANLTSKVEQLRLNLAEASETIDSMKAKFNAACDKFHLYLDDNGEWQQSE